MSEKPLSIQERAERNRQAAQQMADSLRRATENAQAAFEEFFRAMAKISDDINNIQQKRGTGD